VQAFLSFFKKVSPGWLFTAAIFILLLLPSLLMKGMFMDGVIYGAVARNLSLGAGDFWHLKFSDTLLQPFHEHPPLAFYLESLVFRFVGDYYFSERLYTFLIALATAVVLVKVYRLMGGPAHLSWFAVLLWITTERVFWSINQNMLEVTMSFFSLSTVYLLYEAEQRRGAKKLLQVLIAACLLLAAFLSKGFPGLFPLGFYFFRYLSRSGQSFRYFLFNTLIFSGLFLLCGLLLISLATGAKESLLHWLQQQVAGSVQGLDRTGLRWPFISGFFQQLLPMFSVLLALLVILKIKRRRYLPLTDAQQVMLYLGFSAFLPLLISPKLSFYYFVPAIPYFALFTAHYLEESLKKHTLIWPTKKWMNVAALLCLVTNLIFSISQTGKAERNTSLLADVHALCSVLPPTSTLSVSESLAEDWTLFAYLQRAGRLNISRESGANFYLQRRNEAAPIEKKEILLVLSEFRLFSVSNNQ